MRLDLDVALRRQRADERHGEVEPADAMRRVQRCIDEVDLAVLDDDVVEREMRRLATRRLRLPVRRAQAAQHIVEVVLAVGDAADANTRRIDFEPVDHRRQAPDRLGRGVHIDARGLELRRRGFGGSRQRHVGDRQLERPRVEGDLAEPELPAELGVRRLRCEMAQQRRHVEPGGTPEDRQHGQGEDDRCRHATRRARPRGRACGRRGLGSGLHETILPAGAAAAATAAAEGRLGGARQRRPSARSSETAPAPRATISSSGAAHDRCVGQASG